MDDQIAAGQIGADAKYDVEFVGGQLKASINYTSSFGGGSVQVFIGADQILDAIAKAIPGTIDDAIFGLVKTALKAA